MGLIPNKTNLPNGPLLFARGGCPDDVAPHLNPLPPRGEEVLGIRQGGLK